MTLSDETVGIGDDGHLRHHTIDTPVSITSGPAPERRSKADALVRGAPVTIAAGVAVAGVTFLASMALPPTFSASADVLVQAQYLASSDSVTATNDVATQLAQLAKTELVISSAATSSKISASTLGASTSVATLANTNIVRVTVTWSSPDTAATAATAVANQLAATVTKQAAAAQERQKSTLDEMTAALTEARAAVAVAKRADDRAQASPALAGRSAAALSDARERLANLELKRLDIVRALESSGVSSPLSATVSAGAAPSKLAPRPGLYATVTGVLTAAAVAWWLTSGLAPSRARTRLPRPRR